MRYLTADEILSEEIGLHNVCVFPIRECLGREGVFSDKKRGCSVLFLYLAGQREYTTDDGKSFCLNPGELLYVPQYSSYRFRITKAGDNLLDYAIAVNFQMTDKNGETVAFGKQPQIILQNALSRFLPRFKQVLKIDNGTSHNTMLLKSYVYSLCHDIFSELRISKNEEKPWSVILPAINSIEMSPADNTAISVLARRCGVSETYFRQLFKKYTGGESAVSYRNRLRLEQVERMLRTEQVTVEYAAREAGFCDMSHFYRLYKKHKSKM